MSSHSPLKHLRIAFPIETIYPFGFDLMKFKLLFRGNWEGESLAFSL
jgi:hypothetical protein